MDDEEGLKRKLRAIEALSSWATTEGERDAAQRARQRIAARLVEREGERQVEWQFSLDPWSHRYRVGPGWFAGEKSRWTMRSGLPSSLQRADASKE